MIDKAEIAKRIIGLRGNRSQVECAEFLGMEYNTYRDYEFARSAKLEVLAEMSNKFGVSLDWLVFGRGPKYAEAVAEEKAPYGISSEEHDLLALYRGSDEVGREDARYLLERHQGRPKKKAGP